MKFYQYSSKLATACLVLLTVAAFPRAASSQIVTNWVAYNDHRPGPLIPPHIPVRTNWGTSIRATTYDMGAPADTAPSNLTNYFDGQQLAATFSAIRTGAPDDFGAVDNFGPRTNSPAAGLFFGVVDLSNVGIVGVDSTDGAFVTLTFNGLNPAKRYAFRGTGARANGYLPRWSVATISNALEWIDAHVAGVGTAGILNSNSPGANLVAGQAAWNSGDNVEGDLIGWDFILPAPDGSFSVVCAQYLGPIPGGVADSDYAYSFGAIMLAEVETAAPIITTNPPTQTTVEQNRPLNLSVAATGSPLFYQWYKQSVGAIAGATFPTFTIAQVQASDSGDFYAVVYNPLASRTSTVAHVTVNQDVTAPAVAAIFSFPAFDSATQGATFNSITIEFNEAVETASAGNAANYQVPSGGNPTAVMLPNERTAILSLPAPLAEDTAYSVTINGVRDVVNNTMGSTPAPFRTWMRGPGNGLLFEAFTPGPGVEVSLLTNSPVYPDQAFLFTNLWAFESRLAIPDDTQVDFGSRTRGVFIPPVSGKWVFHMRTYDRGQVYFNPNGLDPVGAVLILSETTGGEPRDWDKFASTPFDLQAGQGYYIEALQKSDGTEAIKVAANLFGAVNPQTLGVAIADFDTNALAGPYVGGPLAPRDLGGGLTIVQDLMDVTVEENNPVPFSFVVSNPSKLPLQWRWTRDGNMVSTSPNYNFRPNIVADDGSMISVQVAKVGSVVTSRTMTLHVVPDVTPPRVLEVRGGVPNLSSIEVVFSEFMTRTDAEDFFNYSVPGFTVPSVTLAADDRTATVQLDNPLTLNSTYQITIQNVADLAGLMLASTNFTFVAGGGLPDLAITLSAGQAVISWPAPSTGFVLQGADAIVTPVSSILWTPVGIAPTVINGRNTVSVNAATGNRIFRLIQ
jgi:hypothetical protein